MALENHRKIQPALWNFDGIGGSWVRCVELFEEVLEVSCAEGWDTWCDLSYGHKVMGRLDWLRPTELVLDETCENEKPAGFEDVWVPAGFSRDVLEVYAKGVRRLERSTFTYQRPGKPKFPDGLVRFGRTTNGWGELKEDEQFALIGREDSGTPAVVDPRGPMLVSVS